MTRAILCFSLPAMMGCTGTMSGGSAVESTTAALDCEPDQICPDGSACPEDGTCPDPGDDWRQGCEALAELCAQAGDDGPDAAVCAAWLDDCFPEGDDGRDDPAAAGECADLAAACVNDGIEPDPRACAEWLEACAPDVAREHFDGEVDLLELAAEACDLVAQACAAGMPHACEVHEGVCSGGPIDVGALLEHGCGLLDEACDRGFEQACDLGPLLGCEGGGGGGGDDGTCAELLGICTADWDREACLTWLADCSPPEWRGEGPECQAALDACAEGDLADCEDWFWSCAPDSARNAECADVLATCWAGDREACGEIVAACLASP